MENNKKLLGLIWALIFLLNNINGITSSKYNKKRKIQKVKTTTSFIKFPMKRKKMAKGLFILKGIKYEYSFYTFFFFSFFWF